MSLSQIRITRGLFIIATLLLVAACQPPQSPSGLVYCSEGNPQTFNPQLVTSGTTIDATSHQIYQHLIKYDPLTGDVTPSLAKSWFVSGDGKTYTFIIRENVQFHHSKRFTPTRNLNADDVVFSFSRIIDKNNPFYKTAKNGFPFFQSIDFSGLVQSIKSVGSNKVVFQLTKSDSSFLANLATDFAVVLSKEYADTLLSINKPKYLDQHPIGTGPFKLKQYVKNEYIRYARNDAYWGKPAAVETLVFDITRKSSKRLAKLITNDCSVSALPKPSELIVVEQNMHVKLQQQQGMNVSYWAFNTNKPPFDNVSVRKALALAINKQAILKAVYNNSASIADGLLPPASWAFDPSLDTQEYNPVKAKQLLQQAGVNNLTLDIWTLPTARTYNPNPIKTSQLIQADLAAIGVKARIKSYDWNVFVKRLSKGNYDSVLIGWNADNSDPDNFFSPFLSCAALQSGNNRSNWCNSSFDDLLTKAKSVTTQQTRKAFYQAAETIVMQQQPVVPLAHSNRMVLKRNNLHGVHLTPFGGISFADAILGEPKLAGSAPTKPKPPKDLN
ncbi:MAG: ABC transporter substrate-binding protein [Parashewanella sp.]